MATPIQRILCLAMTVLGPLTIDVPSTSDSKKKDEEGQESKEGAFQWLLGRSVSTLFSCLDWKTLKSMMRQFRSSENCFQSLSATFDIPEKDIPLLQAGMVQLEEWETENERMVRLLEKMENELERTRARCSELTEENADLRRQCDAYSEAGIIMEQDRQQLQSLLSDKCKLQEENQHLEREISSLQELLEYATEHVTEEEPLYDGIMNVEYDYEDVSDTSPRRSDVQWNLLDAYDLIPTEL